MYKFKIITVIVMLIVIRYLVKLNEIRERTII